MTIERGPRPGTLTVRWVPPATRATVQVRLERFDAQLAPQGDWVPLTPAAQVTVRAGESPERTWTVAAGTYRAVVQTLDARGLPAGAPRISAVTVVAADGTVTPSVSGAPRS